MNGYSSLDNYSILDRIRGTLTESELAHIHKRRQEQFQEDPTATGSATGRTDAGENQEEVGRPEWRPVPISELPSEGEHVPWIWGGFLARGYKTSFTGIWKSGKTTLVKHWLKSMSDGASEFCGLYISPTKVLVVSEEGKGLWAGRRDELELTDEVHLIPIPFKAGRPKLAVWTTFIIHLAEMQRKNNYGVIVFDSMHNLWGVQDENNNAEVLSFLAPLNMLTEQGCALLVIAHPTKSDAGEGRATRGGGAWGGFMDLLLEMRRDDPGNANNTRRVLTAYSRWEDTPQELVIELDKDKGEYRVVGTKADARSEDRMAVYRQILPNCELGKTADEIHSVWPEGSIARPAVKTISRDLDFAFEQPKTICRTGAGVKGDPKRYSIPDTIGS